MIDLDKYARAGYPTLAIETWEDRRFCKTLLETFPDTEIFSVASTGGLRNLRTNSVDAATKYPKAFADVSAIEPLETADCPTAFLVVLDFQHRLSSDTSVRELLSSLPTFKARGSMVLLLAPSWTLPAELQHEIPVLKDALPTAAELLPAVEVVLKSTGDKLPKERKLALCAAGTGLTRTEFENAASLSALGDNNYNPEIVATEKMRLINSPAMSVRPAAPVDVLGGLEQFKEYLYAEVLPSINDDRLRVKGIGSDGVPGTGKSLAAEVLSGILGWPLVCANFSSAKGSLQGQSEGTLKHILATADAIAPCILRLDEVEKWAAGVASSGATDGGTTSGMMSIFLTWMQEHTTPVLVYATCNDYDKLPSEFARRFTWFFFDLPTEEEKKEIAAIHLKKLGVEVDGLPAFIASKLTPEWTGAEIEQLVLSAARRTSYAITKESLVAAAKTILPCSGTENIQHLRERAKGKLRPANGTTIATAPAEGRKIRK